MGQRMKQIFALLLFVFAAASLSCTKEIELKDGTLGTEATTDDVQKAINSALANVSIGNATIGQYSSYDYNYRLEQQEVKWYERIDHTLSNIVNKESQVDFHINQDLFTYDLDTGEIKDETSSQFTLSLEKSPSPSSPLSVALKASQMRPSRSLAMIANRIKTLSGACDGISETDSEGHTYDCIKYFNLKLTRATVAAPTLVAAKPNCMNIPGCKLTVQRLQFDEVKWLKNKSVYTIKIDADIADAVADLMYVPVEGGYKYTPSAVSFCDSQPYVQDGIKYQLRKCSVLRDFQ
jgi:hypothetical protein